ncbi:hypothetical protein LCM4577_15190 [Mesorhizobium sp. LCM 4577]|uniref:hypothetical protein n=1 Tax=Mesorhizobium sp. LCM 4577 TaxID=1848288 RepID=UPI0008D91E97|nr:hypothetical protein [Mesorhizobium sp. LCM 4577]OHV61040.1 hypothetical protein LCM4577_15190 [Mesorhizobium sp. LCM 4577]
MNHHSKTKYAPPGRLAHLAALIKDIEAEVADIDKMLDTASSTSKFMAIAGPVGGGLGSASADRVQSFRWVRGQLLGELRDAQDELGHTVEALAAEEDVERIEKRQRQIEIEVAHRREALGRAVANFLDQGEYRQAALYARERALLRAAINREFGK